MQSASLTALEKKQLDCQGICNIAWSFATFSTAGPLTLALSSAALAQASELNPQDLTNLAWCPATLQLEENSSWEVLSGAGTRLAEAAAQRLAWPSSQGRTSTMAWLRDDLLSVVHAFANYSKLTESLYRSSLETLKTAAKVLDVEKEGALPLAMDEMSVLLEQGDVYVLSKAPGWNVSVGWDEVDTPKVVKKSRGKHVQDWLMQNFNTWPVVNDEAAQHGIVHRLDVNTSGALLCSKTYLGYLLAQLQFVARRVQKYYVCVCAGHFPPQRRLLLDLLLESTVRDEPRSIVSERGRYSKTEVVSSVHLRVDELTVSLLQVRLHTGRRHQIRAHLAHEGHPLLGDSSYGGPEVSWCPRVFLHASRLVVNMEEAGGELDVTCPLPEDLQVGLLRMWKPPEQRCSVYVLSCEYGRAQVNITLVTDFCMFELDRSESQVEADRRHRMDLEETAWKAERDELSSALKEQRNKAAQILTQLAFSAGHAPTVEDTKHLEDEVQRATELAWRMRREVEQQVETHRARQKVPHEAVTSAKRHDRHDLEEQQLLQKRLEVERELKAAQEAQLESLRDTVTAVRRQVYQATRENTELRQTLASQQEILRQLQSSTMREPVSL
ncbi:unnamed protein product [Cladocopium goreaui]|uniref:Uncharacterized RNA pseudouridine synthase Caur_0901 (RNA pseudouridylate synthase) (RNA-uridin e isomerase) n=1 Tax=Cladocopium goreaui TaxID=2562237 RepID=A0A9P1DVI8_9DINO|nr:unnamed protein product [Cladocopium goreaui]